MKKVKISKYLVLFTIGLFVVTSLLPSINSMNNIIISDDDTVEITISAGNFNKDIGFGVSIDVLNYRKDSVIINYSITRDRYFVKDFPETYENSFSVPPEDYWATLIGIGNNFIIYNLNISAWYGEYKINRRGICIGELVILK